MTIKGFGMRRITQEELNTIIANHQHYLNRDCKGWEKMRANLSECDCSELDFNKARLNEASLERANLYGASLIGACLDYASLDGAYLDDAQLDDAWLDYASLWHTTLKSASLNGASFYRALLNNASFDGASLNGATLDGASMEGASLKGASLDGAIGLNIPLACPSEGEFIAFKKCQDDRLVKLLIPADARRSSATTNKCRADKATVLEITSLNGKEHYDEATSKYVGDFIYRVGETVTVADFDENRFNECSTGIHFFIDKQAAIDY